MRCFARHRRVLAVLATGLGKTVCFLALARRYIESPKTEPGKRVLILAHRDELVSQPIAKARAMGLRVAREQGSETAVGKPERVIASTIQTMRSRYMQYRPDEIGLLIVDESHHSVASDFRTVIDYFADAFVLGVTATPHRLDGVGLGEVFEAVAFSCPIEDGVADGWLVPVKPWREVIDGLDLSKLRARKGDLEPGALGELMAEYAHPVAKLLVERAGDRPTLVFCCTVAHAFAQAEALRRYTSARVETVFGGTPKAGRRSRQQELLDMPPVREDIVRDFQDGKVQFLINCEALTEGFDAPATRCVAMVRPTQSTSLLVQCLGRGTRPLPDVVDQPELRDDPAGRRAAIAASAKPDLLVLDFSGATEKHSLVGVADALAGRLTPEERLALTQIELVGELTVEQAVQQARILAAEEAARRAAELAEVVSHSYEVDPFHPVSALGLKGLRDDPSEERVSSKMAAHLEKKGVREAAKLSKSTGQKIAGALHRRSELGLCTLPQSLALQKAGVPQASTTRLSALRASELLQQLGDNGWRRPAAWGADPFLGGRR